MEQKATGLATKSLLPSLRPFNGHLSLQAQAHLAELELSKDQSVGIYADLE